MRKMKIFMLFVSSLFFIIIVGGCSTERSANNQSDGTINWDFVIYVGLEHPMGEAALEFAEKVNERSDGKLNITVRPSGELPYTPAQYLAAAGENDVQMSDVAAHYTGGLTVGSFFALPFLVTNLNELEKAMEVMRPYIEEELENHNTKLLYYYPWPVNNYYGTGEMISSYKDWKDKKIRVAGAEESSFLSSIGMNPVSIATPEVPQAIQRGMADGLSTSALSVSGSAWHDFLDWGYRVNSIMYVDYIVVNKDSYDALPEQLQSIVDEAAAEAQKELPQRFIDIDNESMKALEKEHGMEFGEASEKEIEELTESATDIWEEWAKRKGPTAEEALKKLREKLNK